MSDIQIMYYTMCYNIVYSIFLIIFLSHLVNEPVGESKTSFFHDNIILSLI